MPFRFDTLHPTTTASSPTSSTFEFQFDDLVFDFWFYSTFFSNRTSTVDTTVIINIANNSNRNKLFTAIYARVFNNNLVLEVPGEMFWNRKSNRDDSVIINRYAQNSKNKGIFSSVSSQVHNNNVALGIPVP